MKPILTAAVITSLLTSTAQAALVGDTHATPLTPTPYVQVAQAEQTWWEWLTTPITLEPRGDRTWVSSYDDDDDDDDDDRYERYDDDDDDDRYDDDDDDDDDDRDDDDDDD